MRTKSYSTNRMFQSLHAIFFPILLTQFLCSLDAKENYVHSSPFQFEYFNFQSICVKLSHFFILISSVHLAGGWKPPPRRTNGRRTGNSHLIFLYRRSISLFGVLAISSLPMLLATCSSELTVGIHQLKPTARN